MQKIEFGSSSACQVFQQYKTDLSCLAALTGEILVHGEPVPGVSLRTVKILFGEPLPEWLLAQIIENWAKEDWSLEPGLHDIEVLLRDPREQRDSETTDWKIEMFHSAQKELPTPRRKAEAEWEESIQDLEKLAGNPGFAGLKGYWAGDYPEGMIPFHMQGDLGRFEEMYLEPLALLSIEDKAVRINLLSGIWNMGNRQWAAGIEWVTSQKDASFPSTLTPTEAIFGFASWLTTRKEKVVLSWEDDASVVVPLIEEYTKKQGLNPDVSEAWPHNLIPMNAKEPRQEDAAFPESDGKVPAQWEGSFSVPGGFGTMGPITDSSFLGNCDMPAVPPLGNWWQRLLCRCGFHSWLKDLEGLDRCAYCWQTHREPDLEQEAINKGGW